MNFRYVLNLIGRIVLVEAALLLLPAAVSLYYSEYSALISFIIAALIGALFGGALILLFKPREKNIFAGEGFLTVALAWIIMSLIGALPFVISREIPSFVNAFFETVSGFTTTGASILTDIESLSKGILFWRSFTHWIGGMGVLVFVLAILPLNSSRGVIHILRAEVPGPIIGKLVPRAKETARILYLIYIGLTAIEIILLFAGGMPLYESVVHTFGTAGTGGFGVKADSIAGYSPYLQWVITIFMLIFGINFNLFYLILIRRIKTALQSAELRLYLIIVLVCIGVITVNTLSLYDSFSETLRHSAFQVSSIITTTGYATTNFDLWPDLSKGILLLLMFVGACAGSTGGGLKVSRVYLLLKLIAREIRRALHPRAVSRVKFEGKNIGEDTLESVSVYFAVYMLCFVAVFLILCFEPFGIETNLSATAACFNNVGPGFAGVGPTANYSAYSAFSKIVLSAAMLLGRLEIFPLIIAFSPYVWRKK